MMQYMRFLFRKLFSNKNNLRMVLLWLAVTAGLYMMNLEANQKDNYHYRMMREYTHNANMAEHSKDSGLKELYQSFADRYEAILDHLDHQEYREMYDVQLDIMHEQLEMQTYVSPQLNSFQREIDRTELLQKENLLQDSEMYPVMGVPFLLQCFESLFPYVFVLLNCYIFTGLYTERYKERINANRLLPLNSHLDELCIFYVCLFAAVVSFVVLSGFSYVLAGTVSGFSSFRYPYPLYYDYTHPYGMAGELVFPVTVLYLLYAVFSILVVSCTAKILKKPSAVYFVSAAVLLGIGYMMQVVEPMHVHAHMFPTSYINAIHSASGFFRQYVYQNYQFSFGTGIRVLVVSICVMTLADVLLNSREK